MKKTILTLMMSALFGAANASVLEGIDGEAGLKFSTTTLKNGLLLREDSIAGSVDLNATAVGGSVNVGLAVHDVDAGGTDTDISLTYTRSVGILGDDYLLDFSFQKFDSAWGDLDLLSVGTLYSLEYVDLVGSLWLEAGGNDQFGVSLAASKGFELLQEGLVFVPFAEVNVADEFNALEAGLVVSYDLGGGKYVSAKTSWKDNDADGGYALDGSWGYSVSFGYKF